MRRADMALSGNEFNIILQWRPSYAIAAPPLAVFFAVWAGSHNHQFLNHQRPPA
jgi:hypothetical protein